MRTYNKGGSGDLTTGSRVGGTAIGRMGVLQGAAQRPGPVTVSKLTAGRT
jgi:hypothetical protein